MSLNEYVTLCYVYITAQVRLVAIDNGDVADAVPCSEVYGPPRMHVVVSTRHSGQDAVHRPVC